MKRAIERHKRGEACVIPIILRPTDWVGAPFDKLKVLPTDGKPVSKWPTHDDAFEDVVRGIRRAINELNAKAIHKSSTTISNRLIQLQKGDVTFGGVNIISIAEFSIAQRSKEQWLNEGIAYSRLGRHEEALIAFDEAIQLDINFVEAHNNKGIVLRVLNRHEEALAAYERAIQFNPDSAFLYNGRGNILLKLRYYEEALTAYNQAIQLDVNYVEAYNNKGMALRVLSRFEEALSIAWIW